MKGINHLYSGIVAGTTLACLHYNGFTDSIIFLSMVSIGSIIPDIDSSKSFVGRYSRPVSVLVEHILGHRRLLHSPLMVLLLIICCSITIPFSLWIGLIIGYLLHLFLDMHTARGIPLFYPIKNTCYTMSGKRSGKKGEFFRMIYLSGLFCLFLEVVGIVSMQKCSFTSVAFATIKSIISRRF